MTKAKSIDYETIIKFPNITDLHNYIASLETDSFGWMDIDQFAKYLDEIIKIQFKSDFDKWDTLREYYYRRNITVHNFGKISKIYAEKMDINDDKIGNELKTDFKYVNECEDKLLEYINFVSDFILKKFNLVLPKNSETNNKDLIDEFENI